MLPTGGGSDYDVIVVGGGPAGCSFARSMARQAPTGRLLLVDQSRFPRDKVCGDGLTYQAMPVVQQVFPELPRLTPSASCTSRQILCYPNGRVLVREGQALDVIPRLDFDNALWKATVESGVETLEGAYVSAVLVDGHRVRGVRLRDDRGERTLTCRLLVGADGSRSVVRRATGSTTDDYVIHALRQYARGIPDSTKGLFFFFDLEYRGYFWIFPFVRGGERWANVGYGNATDNRRLKERFAYYCQTPEVRRCLGASRFESKLVGFPLNLARFTWSGRLSRSLWGPGYLLVGDAASLIHPLSGEGISFAIESGRIAADVLLDDRVPPTRKGRIYEQRVLRRVRPDFLSGTAFCAIRLPMLLPPRVSDAYLGAACFAYRALRPGIRPREPGGSEQAEAPARPPVPVGPIARPPEASSTRLGLEGCFLAALLGGLALFWILRISGGSAAGPAYGLRTIVFTGLATLFCLAHARAVRGSGFALVFLGVTLCCSLTAEIAGTLTGLVFGPYHYGPDLPGRVLGLVPIVVPFAWFVVSYLSFATAEAVAGAGVGTSSVRLAVRAGMAAVLFVTYDLVADPNHIYRGGWAYAGGGVYYGVPLQNFVAWGALGFTAFLLLGRLSGPIRPRSAWPSALLAVLAYDGVLVHESFFALLVAGHRGPGVLGLAVAAAVFALWWTRARQGSPAPGVRGTRPSLAGRPDTR